jgi:hypothetical protein
MTAATTVRPFTAVKIRTNNLSSIHTGAAIFLDQNAADPSAAFLFFSGVLKIPPSFCQIPIAFILNSGVQFSQSS